MVRCDGWRANLDVGIAKLCEVAADMLLEKARVRLGMHSLAINLCNGVGIHAALLSHITLIGAQDEARFRLHGENVVDKSFNVAFGIP